MTLFRSFSSYSHSKTKLTSRSIYGTMVNWKLQIVAITRHYDRPNYSRTRIGGQTPSRSAGWGVGAYSVNE